METFENTVTIERPVEDVFAFLRGLPERAEWNYAIEETTKTSPGPVGDGDHLPAGTFNTDEESRGLPGDRLRSDAPTRS